MKQCLQNKGGLINYGKAYIPSDEYLPGMYVSSYHQTPGNTAKHSPTAPGFKSMARRDILRDQAQSKQAVSVTYVTLALSPPLWFYLCVVLFTSLFPTLLACILSPYLVRLLMPRRQSLISFGYLRQLQLLINVHNILVLIYLLQTTVFW